MTKPKQKVLLINPRMCSHKSMRLPLSLLHLAAALEGRYEYDIVDGNVLDSRPQPTANTIAHTLRACAKNDIAALCVTVMPGPQIAPAIEISAAVRAAYPSVPIVWGGYFPTLYPDSAINAPYVDFLVRGQGEETLLELLNTLSAAAATAKTLQTIAGVTWKDGDQVRHNAERAFRPPDEFPPLPYHKLANVDVYLRPSFMGTRTAVHQAAIGCRYRCSFCGVVSMFNGLTRLAGPARLQQAMQYLKAKHGANAMQFYDHNFFDREDSSVPILEALSADSAVLPWWCYARADTLANFSASTWALMRKSQLRMAYIGAEAASEAVLKSMHKGTTVAHTLEVAARCRENGVIPEFSFVLGGPTDPEGEVERTLTFIKKLKTIHPACEVILYFYSPTPQRDPKAVLSDANSPRLPTLKTYGPNGPTLPTTPEEWTQPQWINFVCHQDAPWLSATLRQRVKDFARVLACRFPTVQDYRTPQWGKNLLRAAASWRYSTGHYSHPWELDLIQRIIPLRQPQHESL
jgi:hypothetical protein